MPKWIIIFNTIASFFWAFQIIFAYLNIKKQKKITQKNIDYTPCLSVVIPVFNEDQEIVNLVLESLLNQKNVNLDIIVVDDGSENYVSIPENKNIRLIRLENNTGKRGAQVVAFKQCIYDWVVTLDSDTTLNENSLYDLYNSAIRQEADAVGGTIFLSNEKQNWLTKMTSCMYWFSFFQERASQSHFNVMTCCSGALSIYKKQILLECVDEYLNQMFLGQKCVTGDDRHLTNMFVSKGKRVCWSYQSNGYTISPVSFGLFIKQQLRWSRSHTSATVYICENIYKFPLMFLFFIFKMMFRYLYFVALYLILFYSIIVNNSLGCFISIFLTLISVSIIKSFIAWMYTKDWKFGWLLLYSIMSFFVFTPVLFYGLITPFVPGWLTRKKK